MRLDKKLINEETGPDYGILFASLIYYMNVYFGMPPANPNSGPPFPEGEVPPDMLNRLDYNGDGQITFEDMLIALSLHGYGEDVGEDGYDRSDTIPPEYLEGLPKGAVVLGIPAYWYRAMNGIPPYEFPEDPMDLKRQEPMTKKKLLNQLRSDAKIKVDSKVPKSPEMVNKIVSKLKGTKSSFTPPAPPSRVDVKSISPRLGSM